MAKTCTIVCLSVSLSIPLLLLVARNMPSMAQPCMRCTTEYPSGITKHTDGKTLSRRVRLRLRYQLLVWWNRRSNDKSHQAAAAMYVPRLVKHQLKLKQILVVCCCARAVRAAHF